MTPGKVRKAFLKKMKAGLHKSFHGNNPERDKAEVIQWLALKPGTDIEYMFNQGYMIVSYFQQSGRKWVYKLTNANSVHNIICELGEDEL